MLVKVSAVSSGGVAVTLPLSVEEKGYAIPNVTLNSDSPAGPCLRSLFPG